MKTLTASIKDLNADEQDNLLMPPFHKKKIDDSSSLPQEPPVTQINDDDDNVQIIDKPSIHTFEDDQTRLYRRRWFVLIAFALVSMINSFNWIEYSIIQDIVVFYYNESLPQGQAEQNEVVNWMSMVYMIVYIPLVFPAMFLLDRKGLKLSCLLGAGLTCVGAWIKVGGISPDRFWVALCGQTVCAIAQIFTLGIPARLASLWFGNNEMSIATSIGVFGNQFGTALGFLIPPAVIPNSQDKAEIAQSFYYLLIAVAIFCTILLIVSFFVIKDKPDHPPNHAQLDDTVKDITFDVFKRSLIALFKNPIFLLILVSYGINTGSYYSISTLLNQMLITYYKNENEKIGIIGLILVLAGLGGAIIGGLILSKTKAYKLTTFLMYILSFGSMIIFTFTLDKNIYIVFATAFLLGFFMTGYLPVGFEFAAELTYPEPEGTSSGLLNASSQVFGIIFIYIQNRMISSVGVMFSNVFLCSALVFGSVLTILIKNRLHRQNTIKNNKKSKQPKQQPSPPPLYNDKILQL